MPFFTHITLPPPSVTLDVSDRVVTIGSCFAQHVGEHLVRQMGEDAVCVNPFGVLYNPVSIAQALLMLVTGDDAALRDSVFEGRDGLWHSWLFSGKYSAVSCEACETKILDSMCHARQMLKDARLLCVTFGTTRCYAIAANPACVVANCHKEVPATFIEQESPLDALTNLWQQVIDRLLEFNSQLTVCLTVSPYRYRKYGYHESQVQKAKLLLLADAIEKSNARVCYFPSYEIMMDELRDYRFYATDMLHPSEQAVGIIADRFSDWTFSAALKESAAENIKRWKRLQHREINQ